jgi:hypothetical protein
VIDDANEHVLAVIKTFVVEEKQARLSGFIQRRRDDLLDELFIDQRNLKTENLIELPRGSSASFVVEQLRKLGAGNQAFTISLSGKADGKLGGLEDAIESVFDRHIGALVYCLGTRLGYYEDGEISKYILNAS